MRRVLFSVCCLLAALYANGQYLVTIGGREFSAEVDHDNMTAKLIDFEHEIDDNKYPMVVKRRTLKSLKGKTLVIPSTIDVNDKKYTITEIGHGAFADYTNFSSVIIPPTVHTIGDYAFFRTSLVNVKLPATVSRIGDRAFGFCKDLKRLVYADNVQLGTEAYSDSKNIRIETIPAEPVLQQEGIGAKSNHPKTLASTAVKPAAKPVNVTSDIDTNIPVGSGEASQTFAIIIAYEVYQSDVNVDYAVRDGRSFCNYCEKVLGLPKENIRFVENATLNNMKGMVNWISNVAKAFKGKSKIILYYAGHGIADSTQVASLLPVDGFAKDPGTGYSLKTLYKELGTLSAKNVCVFLDACFSGRQRNDEMLVAGRGAMRVKEENPLGNMIVFSATQSDGTAYSYPAQGHGLFSYFLMKKLKETKGNVSLGDLADYVNENVMQKSVVVLNTMQTPSISVSPQLGESWRSMTLK